MGTPVTCTYATIFFTYFEKTYPLPKYKHNLLLYVQQIDDILEVWQDNPLHPTAWGEFQHDIQNQCQLTWKIVSLKKSVDFLDLTISLNDIGVISTSIYQKPSYLHLYTSLHSAHSPGVINSLIHELLHTYYRQNSNRDDFLRMVRVVFQNLKEFGHPQESLSTLFQSAIAKLVAKDSDPFCTPPPITHPSQLDQLFLNIPFHPRDISRKKH